MEQPQPANGQITEQPLAYRAVRNGVWVALGSYWVNGFGFVANIALIRLLTPAIYGEFALAMFFYTLFDLQSKVGLNFAFAQQREVNGETI
ncbi:MAG: polysaccharide biosynthesis protein, partial [Chloroflexi bacterium]